MPAKSALPGSFARFGMCNPPSALTITSATMCRPSRVATCQRPSRNCASTTSALKRRCGRQPILLDAPLAIRPDFGATGKRVTPVGIQFERIRIHMRRHVARDAGVRVLTPRATHRFRFLENHEVRDALLAQLDAHAHAGQPGAEHDHAKRLFALQRISPSQTLPRGQTPSSVGHRHT